MTSSQPARSGAARSGRGLGGRDVFELTAELVDIPSVSHDEEAIADHVAGLLEPVRHLATARIGNNVLARTDFGRPMRLMLAGHLDTVPVNGNGRATIDGDTLSGLGSSDMKGGVAVMLLVMADCAEEASVDLTFVGYVCEEVEQRYSGLLEIEAAASEWLVADAAVLGEPTASVVEAGCQGVLKVDVRVRGFRAHTARPWMGVNAVHRLGPVLAAVSAYQARSPVVGGCEYREALQAVSVSGGVANNVVPDVAEVVLNHRYAPDRTADEAFASVRQLVEPCLDTSLGDSIELSSVALAAAPGLDHPLLARLASVSGGRPRAKLGWTDVSYFSHRGIPAANFGPGEPTLAHTARERVERADLERARAVLGQVVTAAG
ncbi:MAG: succinyl-diaminopimelate desuccinylase [Acidimicrobiales bacterium]